MLFSPARRNKEDPDITGLTDNELVSLYKETGDTSAIGELFNRYGHLLFFNCMKYLKNENDSKDALMQVFEKLFDDLKAYRINDFKSWIYTVVMHHCLYLRKKRQEYAIEENEISGKSPREFMEFGDDFTLYGRPENEDESKKLMKAIGQLKEEQRICIELFFLQEKSYQEIQAITRFDYHQVKSNIQNGKRNLKLILTNSHE